MIDKYAELRAALDAYDADPGSSYARDCFYGNVDSDAIRALLAERDAQAAEIATLRHALRKSAAVLAGLEMNKSALVHALELARDALTQQEQS